MQIGENYYTKQQHKGVLYLSKQKFSYSIEADAINMYHKRQQLIFQLDKANALDAQDVSALLFSLAWMLTNAEISATAAHTASGQYVS